MKNRILIFIMALFTSCDMLEDKSKAEGTKTEETKITKQYAKVYAMQGILLFIESEPAKEYQTLGKVNNEPVIDQVEASNKNKKPLRAGLDMIATTIKNVTYNDKLNMLVDNAKKQYIDEVQGIIIHNNLLSCEAIKFKE